MIICRRVEDMGGKEELKNLFQNIPTVTIVIRISYNIIAKRCTLLSISKLYSKIIARQFPFATFLY